MLSCHWVGCNVFWQEKRKGKGDGRERELKLTGSQQKLALSLLMDLWRLCPQKQTSVIFKPDLLKKQLINWVCTTWKCNYYTTLHLRTAKTKERCVVVPSHTKLHQHWASYMNEFAYMTIYVKMVLRTILRNLFATIHVRMILRTI